MNWFFPEPASSARRGGGGARNPGLPPGCGWEAWLRPLPLLSLLLLAAWAFGTTFWLGRIGFMSLDMPITWDAAWRMMHGQVPCRDFNTPGDVIPALIQIPFFKVCGVTWWGYLAHAGLCNTIFSLGTVFFLARLGAPLLLALLVGVMEGWHFNTPIGVPYYDQYSYFFAFFALAALTLGLLEGERWRRTAWLLAVPPLCVATVLSKVSPGLYALALLPGVFLLGSPRRGRWEALGVLAASAALTVALLAVICLMEGISRERFWDSFFGLPSGIGHDRWSKVGWDDFRTQLSWRLGRLNGLRLSLPAALAAMGYLILNRGGESRIRILVWIALAAPWVDLATVLSADQESLNYMAFGVLSLGAGLVAFGLTWGRRWRSAYAGLFVVMAVALAVVEVKTAWKMTLRTVNNFELPRTAKVSGFPLAGRELRPMVWINSYGAYSAEEFWQVIDFLRAKDEPFFVASQNSLPYALCGRVNPFPAAWMHPGLTFPKSGDPRRPAFDAWAIARLKAAGVRWLVVEPTWGDWLDEFPFLKAWAGQATGSEVDISSWRLIPVDPTLLP